MNYTKSHSKIGILGAGIMGCCLALELSHRGYRVDLIDRASTPMTGASFHNEGKLHLGFVYANDPIKATHGLMLQGSLSFTQIIGRLTACNAGQLKPSQPFHYFVPIDSQLNMEAIENHFDQVEEGIHEFNKSQGSSYLDHNFNRYFKRNPSSVHEKLFSPAKTQGSFVTEERSVSLDALSSVLSTAIKTEPGINFMEKTEILAADRLPGGDVGIRARRKNRLVNYCYPCVANCLWDDRLRIDRTAGIYDDAPWMFRYKVTVNIATACINSGIIPSATGILGSYGDVVNHNDGSFYISWYPISKIAQCTNPDGRALHDEVHRGILPVSVRKITSGFPSISRLVASITHMKFIRDNIKEMAAYIPSMENLLKKRIRGELGGGVIAAQGFTDIDDPSSTLHQRSAIGPVAHESYVTVDTGKLCMGPLFAERTADIIVGILK